MVKNMGLQCRILSAFNADYITGSLWDLGLNFVADEEKLCISQVDFEN